MFPLTFLNSTFLAALGAAALPILIHFLTRRRAEVVYFSNVAFLKALQENMMRRARIRQVLLLILRTLIVALIALAFARPALKGTVSAVGGRAATSAVVLLDNSYSMGYRTDDGPLFGAAKGRAGEALKLFTDSVGRRSGGSSGDVDEVSLLPFADEPVPLPGGATPSLLRDALREVPLTDRTTQVGAALREAGRRLAASAPLNREVYLISDMTTNGWRDVGDSIVFGGGPVSVYLVPQTVPPKDNISLDRVEIADQIVTAGRPISVRATVTNRGEEALSGLLIHLYLDGRRVRQEAVALEGGGTKTVPFEVVPEHGGILTGYAEIGDDRLEADNRRYFTLDVPEALRVLLVGGREEDTYFLRSALSAEASQDSLIVVVATTMERLSPEQIAGSRAVVLSNVPRLSEEQTKALHRHVWGGGGLAIALGPDIDAGFYNRDLLPGLMGATLRGTLGDGRGASAGDSGTGGPPVAAGRPYYALSRVVSDHPIFRGLVGDAGASVPYDSPRFYRIYDVALSDDAAPMAIYANGGPALCEATSGRGRVILLTTGLDLTWTDLPLKGLFVPLVYRLVEYLTSDLSGRQTYTVGAHVARRIPGADPRRPVACEDPIGERREVWPDDSGGPVLNIGPVDRPGIWRLSCDGIELDRFAVNVETEESSLQRMSEEQMERIFRGHRVHWVHPGTSLEQVVMRSRYGTELWRLCLLLALGLMVAEMVIAQAGKGTDKH